MFRPVSVTMGVCLGYTALNPYVRPTSAVSDEAREVAKRASAITECAETSQALFGDRAEALDGLAALGRECAEPDWDGEGAMAVAPEALEIAEAFLRVLPEGIPMPELAPEPDGSISLDWIRSRHRMLSLSIGRSARLAYAWLDGSDRGHAVATFDGVSVPRAVLLQIRAVVGNGDDSLRTA